MPVPDQIIEEIRARCDIVDVIGSYVKLTRAGSSHKALCPFHKEKTPSFHVQPARQSFHCFGCGKGGDVFRFIMEYESLDFPGALKLLARRAGVALEFTESARRNRSDKDALYRLHEEAAAFFRAALRERPEAAAARAYLAERRLDGEAEEAFGLGYAPDAWDELMKWAAARGHPDALLETAGLVVRGEREGGGEKRYDRFRRRLMIPIRDEQGRVIAFSGRVLRAEDSPAKYVNSPETPIFRKSRVLFGLDRARRAIAERRLAVLCEGQFDTIRCQLAGVTHAVAAQGTAVTEEHARILKRYADSAVLLLDADEAGRNAAVRSARILLAEGLSVRIAALPPGEDPDSLVVTQGVAALEAVLQAAATALEFQIALQRSREAGNGSAGELRVARSAIETIRAAPSAVQRELLLEEAGRLLGVSVAALRRDLEATDRGAPAEPRAGARAAAGRPDEPPPDELALAELLLGHPETIPLAQAWLPPARLRHDGLRRAVELILAHGATPGWRLSAVAPEDEAFSSLASRLESGRRDVRGEADPLDGARELICRIWRRTLEARREELRAALGARGLSPDERMQRETQSSDLLYQIKKLQGGWAEAEPVLEMLL